MSRRLLKCRCQRGLSQPLQRDRKEAKQQKEEHTEKEAFLKHRGQFRTDSALMADLQGMRMRGRTGDVTLLLGYSERLATPLHVQRTHLLVPRIYSKDTVSNEPLNGSYKPGQETNVEEKTSARAEQRQGYTKTTS